MTPSFLSNVIKVYHPASLSDQMDIKIKILVSLSSPPKVPKRDNWKLNAAFLSENNFMSCFESFWEVLLQEGQNSTNITEWLDREARDLGFLCGFSAMRTRCRRDTKKLFVCLKRGIHEKNWYAKISRLKEEIGSMIKFDSYGFLVSGEET